MPTSSRWCGYIPDDMPDLLNSRNPTDMMSSNFFTQELKKFILNHSEHFKVDDAG